MEEKKENLKEELEQERAYNRVVEDINGSNKLLIKTIGVCLLISVLFNFILVFVLINGVEISGTEYTETETKTVTQETGEGSGNNSYIEYEY